MSLFKRKKEPEAPSLCQKNLLLFSTETDLDKIMEILDHSFGREPSPGKGNTLDLQNGDIHISIVVLSPNLNEEITEQIQNMLNWAKNSIFQIETEQIGIKTNLFYHMESMKSVLSLSISFLRENEEMKWNMIMEPFLHASDSLHAVLAIPDDPFSFYCKDENGQKRLILSAKGKSELEGYLPNLGPGIEFSETIPEECKNRRLQSRKLLNSQFIYVPPFYPVIEQEKDCTFRSPEEIVKRAIGLLAVSLYSECRLGEGNSHKEALDFVNQCLSCFCGDQGLEQFCSPKEWSYLNNPDSTEQEQISYSWQYENLYVMEWALGMWEELEFPDHICDVGAIVHLISPCNSIQEILDLSRPRTGKELLDACDLIFCLDWACVDARLRQIHTPANMDGGVVMERHKSLNWLVGYEDSASWDEVFTNT